MDRSEVQTHCMLFFRPEKERVLTCGLTPCFDAVADFFMKRNMLRGLDIWFGGLKFILRLSSFILGNENMD